MSTVTDEFIAHLRALGDQLDLDQASEFLVVASTLLDLKAARLLPAADVDDEDDLELLEARDLLFARLLQYKAYKQAARFLREREAGAAHRHARSAALEPRFADLVPEVVLDLSPQQFAAMAARVLAPKAPEVVSVSHLHAPPVSVSEQLLAVRNHLVRSGTSTFRALTADCGHTLEVVARFLALLELYRQQRVVFEQLTPLGSCTCDGPVGPARRTASTSTAWSRNQRTRGRTWTRSTRERADPEGGGSGTDLVGGARCRAGRHP
ncbi:segregation and condensation protein A [Blastococcus brunescens]|uniref:Segregation and condensation protein A n=1 Tax=Blastococcus brunescens TaxID=1564165 RepID=A0ABZ1BAI1_9ACTN|nr:segregation/condensation protein A [Blastococcus sp. BMG 8361]WRL66978.1 segregation/condensation protein A [Blastococcus sp. BMG 8361]